MTTSQTDWSKPRRLKTYPAESGYVYEYYFLESRAHRRLLGGQDFVYRFHVTTGRKNFVVQEVVLEEKALRAWQRANGRELSGNERYAAAKMGLFRSFDECSEPRLLRRAVVSEANIHALLEPLGLTE